MIFNRINKIKETQFLVIEIKFKEKKVFLINVLTNKYIIFN